MDKACFCFTVFGNKKTQMYQSHGVHGAAAQVPAVCAPDLVLNPTKLVFRCKMLFPGMFAKPLRRHQAAAS